MQVDVHRQVAQELGLVIHERGAWLPTTLSGVFREVPIWVQESYALDVRAMLSPPSAGLTIGPRGVGMRVDY